MISLYLRCSFENRTKYPTGVIQYKSGAVNGVGVLQCDETAIESTRSNTRADAHSADTIPESDSEEAPQLEHDDDSRTSRVEQQSRVAEPSRFEQVRPPLDGYPQPVLPFKILHPPLA